MLNPKAFLFLFQETDRRVQKSESVITRAFYSAHGAIIMNGLTTLSRSSNSIAKVLQPQLARKLTELNILSRRLLRTSNTPKQPLYRMQVGKFNYPSHNFLNKFCSESANIKHVTKQQSSSYRFSINSALIDYKSWFMT